MEYIYLSLGGRRKEGFSAKSQNYDYPKQQSQSAWEYSQAAKGLWLYGFLQRVTSNKNEKSQQPCIPLDSSSALLRILTKQNQQQGTYMNKLPCLSSLSGCRDHGRNLSESQSITSKKLQNSMFPNSMGKTYLVPLTETRFQASRYHIFSLSSQIIGALIT